MSVYTSALLNLKQRSRLQCYIQGAWSQRKIRKLLVVSLWTRGLDLIFGMVSEVKVRYTASYSQKQITPPPFCSLDPTMLINDKLAFSNHTEFLQADHKINSAIDISFCVRFDWWTEAKLAWSADLKQQHHHWPANLPPNYVVHTRIWVHFCLEHY